MKKRSSALQPLTSRLRRVQFLIGLGFASAVAGALLSSSLLAWLRPLLEALPGLVAVPVSALIARLWVLAALPALCYGAARLVDLSPWGAALGAAVTGESFYLLLDLATWGVEGLVANWSGLLIRVVTLAGGVLLSRQAILRGRGAAERARTRAQQKAAANRAQYEEFAREAERLAARHEAKPGGPEGDTGTTPGGA